MARILVIEDDPDTRAFLEETLKTAGNEVLLAADGVEGLEQHRVTPAELVITDLYMPNKDGLETIMQLRKEFPRLTIIAMSGKANAGPVLAIAKHLGAAALLEKPFFPAQLLSAVEKALSGDRATG
jgi:CheY-like chemotaxis protein